MSFRLSTVESKKTLEANHKDRPHARGTARQRVCGA